MDPNEQEMDEKLIKAEEVEDSATIQRSQGNENQASELEEKADEMKTEAEQGKIDTESQINEGNIGARSPDFSPVVSYIIFTMVLPHFYLNNLR